MAIASNSSFAVVQDYDELFREAMPLGFVGVPMRKLPPTVVPMEALSPRASSASDADDAVGRRKRAVLPLAVSSAIDAVLDAGLAALSDEEKSEHDPIEAQREALREARNKKKQQLHQQKRPVSDSSDDSGSDSDEEEDMADSEDDDSAVDAMDIDSDSGDRGGSGDSGDSGDSSVFEPSDDDDAMSVDGGADSDDAFDGDEGAILCAARGALNDRSLTDSNGAAAAAVLSADELGALRARHANNLAPLHVSELSDALFSYPSTIAGVISRTVPKLKTTTVANESAIQRAVHTIATVHAVSATGDMVSARHIKSLRDDFAIPQGSTHDLREKVDKLSAATADLYALTMSPTLQKRMMLLLGGSA
jgi:hypothetical protein